MIKKILCALGLGLLIASCSGDYTDWANPKTSGPEEGKTVTLTAANAAAIDYATLTADSVQIFVPTLAVSDVATTSYVATLTNEAGDTAQVKTNAEGMADALQLKAAVEKLYGKSPTQRDIAMTIAGYTNVNGESILNTTTATATVTLTAPFIDTAYYLIGDMTAWSTTLPLTTPFTHNGTGSVYDDPTFTIVFTTTAPNQYWKIIPQTNVDAGNVWAPEGPTSALGVVTNGDPSMTGNLTTVSPQAGMIPEAGIYRMTIDMMSYTYTIEPLDFTQYIYLAGDDPSNNWGAVTQPLNGPSFDGKYQGYYSLATQFKFKEDPTPNGWSGTAWGASGTEGTLSTDAGASNLTLDTPGFYQINVNLATLTYNIAPCSISLIGDATAGAWDQTLTTPMTYNATTGAWECTTTLGAAPASFKFIMNNDWTWSWGGTAGGTDYNHLTENNGANLTVSAAGSYLVQFYLSTEGSNKVVLTQQ